MEREREGENSKSKKIFYKDCSLGSERERGRQTDKQTNRDRHREIHRETERDGWMGGGGGERQREGRE